MCEIDPEQNSVVLISATRKLSVNDGGQPSTRRWSPGRVPCLARCRRPRPPGHPLYDSRTDGLGVNWSPEEFIFQEAAASLHADIGGRSTALTKAQWGRVSQRAGV